jgi:hypothetical protein
MTVKAARSDERDVCEPMPTEPITGASHKFEPAGTSADDDNATKVALETRAGI